MDINDAKIQINKLEQLIKDMEDLQDKAYAKSEKFRKMALISSVSGGIGHCLGGLTTPLIALVSLSTSFAIVLPSAILMMRYEDKVDHYKNQISECEKKIEILKEEITSNYFPKDIKNENFYIAR